MTDQPDYIRSYEAVRAQCVEAVQCSGAVQVLCFVDCMLHTVV